MLRTLDVGAGGTDAGGMPQHSVASAPIEDPYPVGEAVGFCPFFLLPVVFELTCITVVVQYVR